MGDFKKILVISIAGIGNTIMALPLISTLAKQGEVHLLISSKATKELLKNNKDIKAFHFLKKDWKNSILFNLKSVNRIRKEKFNESYMVFPGNRWFFNTVSYLCGAKKRYAHKYPNNKLTSLYFLNNKFSTIAKTHDVYQNLRMLDQPIEELKFDIGVKKIKRDNIIGIHPGSNKESSMLLKRWPEKYYAEVINNLEEPVRVFIGPEEEESYSKIKNHLKREVEEIRNLSLDKTAIKINECSIFIANDSGLTHIAAALDIPTIAIFGPTEQIRTIPFTEKRIILSHKMPCQPCNHSFYNLGQHRKCIHSERYCLTRLEPNIVLSAIKELQEKYK